MSYKIYFFIILFYGVTILSIAPYAQNNPLPLKEETLSAG